MLKIIDSSKISQLSISSLFDLVAGVITVGLSPSKFTGNGAATSTVVFSIEDPGGVELSSGASGPAGSDVSAELPTIGGVVKYGEYKITAVFNDGVKSYTDIVKFNLCAPYTGDINFSIQSSCSTASVLVLLNDLPLYKGVMVSEYAERWEVESPGHTDPVVFDKGTPFSFPLVEGVNKVIAELDATYKLGDNVYVKTSYKSTVEKKIRCFVDMCYAYQAIHDLMQEFDEAQGEKKETLDAKLTAAFRLLSMVKIGEESGCQTADLADALEELLGIEYSCLSGYNSMRPAPVEKTMPYGCGVSSSTENSVATFTVNNYIYSVSLVDQKGWVKVVNTSDGCAKNINFDFDWSEFADNLLERFEGPDNTRFLGVFNADLAKANPRCIDTSVLWVAKGWAAKIQKWLETICTCCETDGVTMALHCGYATINTAFIPGVPSTGNIVIPVTVTGAGSVTVAINSYGITGTVTVVVDEDTEEVTVPVTYDGSEYGNDGIKILIPVTFSEADVFVITIYGNNLPADFITITGADLDENNIYRNDRILGRTVLVFYNGINRYLLRDPDDLTFPASEWDYEAQESLEVCRDSTVIATWDGGSDSCEICIPVHPYYY